MSMTKTLGLAALLATTALGASAQEAVRFWYHFDNPDNPMSDLVAQFEEANPGITVEAENVPWNSYYDQLYTAIIGGNAPDAAMVKMFAQPRLIEMGALEPIGDRIESWEGAANLQDNLLELTQAADGSVYYLPIQYVVLYLYYRPSMFEEAGVEVPTTCEEFREAANALTRDTNGDGNPDVYGFGFRGGPGGHDHWASLTLSREGADLVGGMQSEAALEGTQFVVDLFREDGVFPPSAPNDGFQEIIGAFQNGVTAMTIHHIGSANAMVEALGDDVSATVVPECGGGRWTAFGDEFDRHHVRLREQGRGVEVDLVPLERGQQCHVQHRHRPAAGDARRQRGLVGAPAALRAGDGRLAALREPAAERARDLGLREYGLASEHAAGADRRDHRRADERRDRRALRRVTAAGAASCAAPFAEGS